MFVSRFAGVLVFAALSGSLVIAGCGASTSGNDEKEDDLGSMESELQLNSPRYLGPIVSGQTKTDYYYSPPRYRAFGFMAAGGDQITAEVKGSTGNSDAVGWITSSSYDVLALNDDASSRTRDAKVVYTVPAGTLPKSYRIVFRDYNLLNGVFTIKLSITPPAVEPVTCSYGGKSYKAGDSFAATDGCNTCRCTTTGATTCTQQVCACNPEAEPWREYKGTPTTCQTIRYTCGFGKRSFQNACGCGCEKSS